MYRGQTAIIYLRSMTEISILKSYLNGSILDIGCGENTPIKEYLSRFYSVGVDIYTPYLQENKKNNVHTEYIKANINNLNFIKDSSFDCVIALDVIEHLEKDDGYRLLKQMNRIAKKTVVVMTPNGYINNPVNHNLYQRHRSGWSVKDFKLVDFDIIGFNGFKYFRKESAIFREPNIIFMMLSKLSESFCKQHPQHAFQLLCVLQKRGNII